MLKNNQLYTWRSKISQNLVKSKTHSQDLKEIYYPLKVDKKNDKCFKKTDNNKI